MAEFYVATSGSDSDPGTEMHPFATLSRAQRAARIARVRAPAQPISVWVRDGTYYLDEPLVLGPEDSGTERAPTTYAAYPGEKPTLSGGTRLVCTWRPFRDGIWMCNLPPDPASFDQLFVNGKRQIRARYPNGDSASPDRSGYLHPLGADTWPHREVYYDPETFSRKPWPRADEAILHIFPSNHWGNLQYRLRGLDRGRNALLLGDGGWQLSTLWQIPAGTRIDQRSRFFIENVFEELDAPREWYLDRQHRILYYMPPDDVDLASAIVETPRVRQLIEVRGTKSAPVRHLHLRGFRLAHTSATFLEPYDIPSSGDWAIYRGGTVFMEGIEDCAVEGCFFDAVGGNGLFVNHYAAGLRIADSLFAETGESAVCLVGKSHLRPDGHYTCPYCGKQHSWSWGEPSDEIPTECLIHNNLIHDVGVFGKQTAGVFMSLVKQNTISHNHIYRTPRAAICINEGVHGGHIVEYNDIHDTVRETGDHGPFNSWGRDRFWCLAQSHGPASHPAGDVLADARYTTEIRYNHFRDRSGWGIDLDDGTSNYHVHHNLCVGISVKLREGDYRTVENNIFVNGANPPGSHIMYEDNHDRFVRNIIVANSALEAPEVDIDFWGKRAGGKIYDLIGPPRRGAWFQEWDYNLFTSDIGEFRAAVHWIRDTPRHDQEYTLSEWRALGWDQHSLYGDPLFVDPQRGDYRLRPESPAFELGFEVFDVRNAGILPAFPRTWLEPDA